MDLSRTEVNDLPGVVTEVPAKTGETYVLVRAYAIGVGISHDAYTLFLVAPLAGARRDSSSHDSPIEERPYTTRYSSLLILFFHASV